MKIRDGFVSNSSSTSFVVNKSCMSVCEMEEFQKLRDNDTNRFNSVGETLNWFFGIIDRESKMCKWLEIKNFNDIEWD